MWWPSDQNHGLRHKKREKAMSQSLLSCHDHAHVVNFMYGLVIHSSKSQCRICGNHVTKDFSVRVVVIAQSYQRTLYIIRGWFNFFVNNISFLKMSSICSYSSLDVYIFFILAENMIIPKVKTSFCFVFVPSLADHTIICLHYNVLI